MMKSMGWGILLFLTASVCWGRNEIFRVEDTGFTKSYTDPQLLEDILDSMQVHCILKPYSDKTIIDNTLAGHKLVGVRIHTFKDAPDVRIVDLLYDVFMMDGQSYVYRGPSSTCGRDE